MRKPVMVGAIAVVLVAVASIFYATCDRLDAQERERELDRARERKRNSRELVPADQAAAPNEREPTYDLQDSYEALPIRRAMRRAMEAVYETCKGYAPWREGTVLKAVYVEPMGKRRHAIVNVSASLARPAVVDEHTLWFQVDLDEEGEPMKVTTTKRLRGRSDCGL